MKNKPITPLSWHPVSSNNYNDEDQEILNIVDSCFQEWIKNPLLFKGLKFVGKCNDQEYVSAYKKEFIASLNLNKVNISDNDYIHRCYLAINLLQQCNGNSQFFDLIDAFTKCTHTLKKILFISAKKLLTLTQFNNLNSQLITSANIYCKNTITDNNLFNSPFPGVNQYFEQQQQDWYKNAKISTLWDMINPKYNNNYDLLDKNFAFYILYLGNKENYLAILQNFKEPYSIYLGLKTIEDELDLSQWQWLVEHAKPAFDNSGRWNKKTLVPLLINFAYERLTRFHNNMGTFPTKDDINHALSIMMPISKKIFKVLIKHHKFGLLRWLLYQLKQPQNIIFAKTSISMMDNNYSDIPQFIISNFSLGICNHFDWDKYIKKGKLLLWKNAEDYEYWHLYVLYSLYVEKTYPNSLESAQLVAKNFFDSWYFDVKNWYATGNKGETFRKQSVGFTYADVPNGMQADKFYYLSYLLYLSINQGENLTLWKQIVISIDLLLNIDKFQRHDEKFKYANIHLSQSLRLFFTIGQILIFILATKKHKSFDVVYNDMFNLLFRAFEIEIERDDIFPFIKILATFHMLSIIRPNDGFEPFLQSPITLEGYFYKLKPYPVKVSELSLMLLDNKYPKSSLKKLLNSIDDFNLDKIINYLNIKIRTDRNRYSDFEKALKKLIEIRYDF